MRDEDLIEMQRTLSQGELQETTRMELILTIRRLLIHIRVTTGIPQDVGA